MFIAVIIFLPLQFVFSYFIAEPYPAFIMPGFANIPDKYGYVEILQPALQARFDAGERRSIMPDELFFDAKQMIVPSAFLNTMFSPALNTAHRQGERTTMKNAQTPEADLYTRLKSLKGAIRAGLSDVFPGIAEKMGKKKIVRPQTTAWLRQRLVYMFPGKTPLTLEVAWINNRYAITGDTATLASDTVDIVVIDLQERGMQ